MEKPTTLCPFCKTQFDVEEDWIGQQTTCPVCGKDFTIRLKEVQIPKAVPQKPVQTPPQPATSPKAVPAQPVQKAVPAQPVQKAVPAQPVQKAVPAQPVQMAVPVRKEPEVREKRPFPRPSRKVIVTVCVCVGLALLGTGGYFVKCKITEAKLRAAQEEKRRQDEAEKRAAEEKRQRGDAAWEAARKAAEEGRQREEAEKKAAEEKRRKEEDARKAEQEKKLSEARQKISSEWESALKQKKLQKIFLWAPGREGSQVLLFRYDDQLAASIGRALYIRNRLARYRNGVFSAVSAYEKNDLAAVDKLYQSDLKELEPNADVLSKQMADLSEKIAALAAKSDLLAGQFAVPADGLVREEISPGKYIAVHLSGQEDCFGYIFLKENAFPAFLELRDGRWYDVAEKNRIEKCCIETQIPGLVFFAELKKNLYAVGGKTKFSVPPYFAEKDGIGALDFRGSRYQGIRYSWTPITQNAPRTVSLWFCGPSKFSGNRGCPMLSYGAKENGKYFDIETNSANQLNCAWGEPLQQYSPYVSPGRWHHVAVTYDGKTRICYLDGRLVSKVNVKLNTAASPLMIGARIGDEGHFLIGSVRNAAAYDRVLSKKEITKIRRLGVGAEQLLAAAGGTAEFSAEEIQRIYEIAETKLRTSAEKDARAEIEAAVDAAFPLAAQDSPNSPAYAKSFAKRMAARTAALRKYQESKQERTALFDFILKKYSGKNWNEKIEAFYMMKWAVGIYAGTPEAKEGENNLLAWNRAIETEKARREQERVKAEEERKREMERARRIAEDIEKLKGWRDGSLPLPPGKVLIVCPICDGRGEAWERTCGTCGGVGCALASPDFVHMAPNIRVLRR